MSLEFASDNLKDNEIIVTMAIQKNIHAIIYASDRLKQDKTFIIKFKMLCRILIKRKMIMNLI
jgi:hypothetical protein